MRNGPLRRAVAVAAIAVSALTLSGCIAINSTSTSQPQSMGPLKLTVNACATGAPGCTGPSNGGSIYGFLNEAMSDDAIPAQYLMAIRLPSGSTPSQSFQASHGGGTLAFARSTSYEAELQALEPAPPGERWWGWISAQVSYSLLSPQSFSATVETTLPRPTGDGPLPSPLRWRPVVGGRSDELGLAATRPVDCGVTSDDLYTGFSETNTASDTVACVDSTSADATRGFLDAPLIDFGIVGNTVQAPAGSTVSATFVARRSGVADPTTTFSLTATTGVPGGSVSLDQQSVSLGGDATQPVLATVSVPANVAPGSYPVTVTGNAPGKPTRTGTSFVTVPGKSLQIRKATVAPRRFRAGRKVSKPRGRTPIGTKLTVDVSVASKLSIAIERKVKGRRKRTFKRVGALKARKVVAGKTKIGFPGRLGGKRLSPGSYRFVLVATDSAKRKSAPARPAFTVVD